MDLNLPSVNHNLFGQDLLRDPQFNKGLAFNNAERRLFKIEGLLPAIVLTQNVQVERVLEQLGRTSDPLSKYMILLGLRNRNERLFYKVLTSYVEEMMPLVYTPTVGLACQKFGHIYRNPQGLYINLTHLGRVKEVLQTWTNHVNVIVFTDGERILGLGDLGAYGMGIPIGKLFLYTACGGVNPAGCLPVTIDTGTNNESLLADNMYTGLKQPRERSELYDQLIEEFITESMNRWGDTVLLQFEDFANQNAFRLLDKYRDRCCCFNDDIQGTAAVVLGGIYSAVKAMKANIRDQVFMFYGAGSAGIGIANLIAYAITLDNPGVSMVEARKNIWLIDSRGLIYKGRESGGISGGKVDFAHECVVPASLDLVTYIKLVKPTALIGVCAQPGVFTEDACKEMCKMAKKPLIFALSNPTSKAECSAEQAYTWTDGKCFFASGSPFDTVTLPDGRSFTPGQGNNSFIFPGVGMAVTATKAERVTEKMFYLAAKTLGELVTEDDIKIGLLYPRVSKIREVSTQIAIKVAELIFEEDLSSIKRPRDNDIAKLIRSGVYSPEYPVYATDSAL